MEELNSMLHEINRVVGLFNSPYRLSQKDERILDLLLKLENVVKDAIQNGGRVI